MQRRNTTFWSPNRPLRGWLPTGCTGGIGARCKKAGPASSRSTRSTTKMPPALLPSFCSTGARSSRVFHSAGIYAKPSINCMPHTNSWSHESNYCRHTSVLAHIWHKQCTSSSNFSLPHKWILIPTSSQARHLHTSTHSLPFTPCSQVRALHVHASSSGTHYASGLVQRRHLQRVQCAFTRHCALFGGLHDAIHGNVSCWS